MLPTSSWAGKRKKGGRLEHGEHGHYKCAHSTIPCEQLHVAIAIFPRPDSIYTLGYAVLKLIHSPLAMLPKSLQLSQKSQTCHWPKGLERFSIADQSIVSCKHVGKQWPNVGNAFEDMVGRPKS